MKRGLIVVLIMVFLGLSIYFSITLYPYTQEHITSMAQRWKSWAPIVLVLLHSFQVIVAPIPGQVFPFSMGFLYGPAPGILMALTGIFIGSTAGYGIGFWGGEKMIARGHITKIQEYRAKLQKRSLLWLTILFLLPIPGVPKDALCFFAGIIGIPPNIFVLSVLIGRLPGEIFWVLTGSGALHLLQ